MVIEFFSGESVNFQHWKRSFTSSNLRDVSNNYIILQLYNNFKKIIFFFEKRIGFFKFTTGLGCPRSVRESLFNNNGSFILRKNLQTIPLTTFLIEFISENIECWISSSFIQNKSCNRVCN